MTPHAKKGKAFDCVEFKREAQGRLREATRGMTAEQRRRYLREVVEQGALADFWRKLTEEARQAPKAGRLGDEENDAG